MSKLRNPSLAAFTLVELMVSTAILALIMAILLQMTGQTAATWRYGAAKVEQFQEARKAFETMTRRLSDATLNTYWDYYQPEGEPIDPNRLPTDYVRQSELRFRVVRMSEYNDRGDVYRPTYGVFFQAPFGTVESDDQDDLGRLDNLLNTWGYFVEVQDTGRDVPQFLRDNTTKRIRSRLMELRQPAPAMDLFNLRNQYTGPDQNRSPEPAILNGLVAKSDDIWFSRPINDSDPRPVRVLAENILTVVFLPRLTPADEQARRDANQSEVLLSPFFTYHSKQKNNYNKATLRDTRTPGQLNPKNQLPPMVQVAMFAIDEISADRLALGNKEDLGLAEMLGEGGTPLFADAEKFETSQVNPGGDLAEFEKRLIDKRLSYRLFTSNVSIRGAKWSSATAK